jgi:hypothetical protein
VHIAETQEGFRSLPIRVAVAPRRAVREIGHNRFDAQRPHRPSSQAPVRHDGPRLPGAGRLRGGGMSMRRALQVVLAISLIGMAFSGTLVYRELFAAVPAAGRCTALGDPGTILGYPPCVYGLIMYTALVVTAALGLRAKGVPAPPAR